MSFVAAGSARPRGRAAESGPDTREGFEESFRRSNRSLAFDPEAVDYLPMSRRGEAHIARIRALDAGWLEVFAEEYFGETRVFRVPQEATSWLESRIPGSPAPGGSD